MSRPMQLTKQWLMERGIVNITLDGKIYDQFGERRIFDTVKTSRWGEQVYKVFSVYDPDLYMSQKARPEQVKVATGDRNLLVHRAVWAWNFNGTNANTNGHYCPAYTAPANFDIDHIDDNSINNNFENLQLLTRQENLRKRGTGYRNQYAKSYKEVK